MKASVVRRKFRGLPGYSAKRGLQRFSLPLRKRLSSTFASHAIFVPCCRPNAGALVYPVCQAANLTSRNSRRTTFQKPGIAALAARGVSHVGPTKLTLRVAGVPQTRRRSLLTATTHAAPVLASLNPEEGPDPRWSKAPSIEGTQSIATDPDWDIEV